MMSAGRIAHQAPGDLRARVRVAGVAAALLIAAWLAFVGPADAQVPAGGGIGVTPVATAGRRAPANQPPRGAAQDLSAPLPVPTLVPTVPPPTPTLVVLPATLTPVPPTPIPTATAAPPASPTAVSAAALPSATVVVAAAPEPVPAPHPPVPPSADDRPPAPLARQPLAAALTTPPQAAPPPRSYVIGLPVEGGWLDDMLLWLGVPSRTQFDGTPYAGANCGPSALGMILEAFGLYMPTHEIRQYANYLQGTYGYDDGIALDHLAEIARRAGLKAIGLYGGGGYRRWTIDDVRDEVLAGHPVIVLTKYRLLPGNGGYGGNINHYIVITGLLDDDFLYNDSAFGGGGGRGLLISAAQLEAAWATADIPRHAVSFALGEQGSYGLLSLDATRFGRGSGRTRASGGAPERTAPAPASSAAASAPASRFERQEAARARLVAGPEASSGPADGRARLRDDPAAQAREALLAAPGAATSLLDTPLAGGTAALGVAPAAVIPPPAVDEIEADLSAPLDERGPGFPAFLLLVAGLGSLYLLLLGQGAWSWLVRRVERR